MPYIFGKLWHLAIIWAIRKAFQCILQGVRILLAKYTRFSPTSENESCRTILHRYHFSSCTISHACIIGGKIRASCILCNTKNNQEENMTQPDGKSTTALEFLWCKNHLWHWWLNILWDDLADSGEFFYCRARDEWIPLQSLYGR